AMAISIYLLIRLMETTSTTTTSTQLRWNLTGLTIVGIRGSSGSASNQLYTPYHLTLNLNYFALSGTTVAGKNATATTALDNLYYSTGIIVDSPSASSSNNELDNPYGITRNSNTDTLYIADTNNNRIMGYGSNVSSGYIVTGGNDDSYWTLIAGITGLLGNSSK
ncbi:unnamed protein product, partial [Rotaria sp. Silwood2]